MKRIIIIVSAYAPQQGLAVIEKDKFYELPISFLSRLSENEVVFLGGDSNGHVGRRVKAMRVFMVVSDMGLEIKKEKESLS